MILINDSKSNTSCINTDVPHGETIKLRPLYNNQHKTNVWEIQLSKQWDHKKRTMKNHRWTGKKGFT